MSIRKKTLKRGTNEWGPIYWYVFHRIALTYDKKVGDGNVSYRRKYQYFYMNYHAVLPCEVCRKDFKKVLSKNPINRAVLTDSTTLFHWTVARHNDVNRKLKRPIFSKERAENKYIGKPISHKILDKFMMYLFRNSLRNTNIGIIREYIRIFRTIYPCEKCRDGLTDIVKKSKNLRAMKTTLIFNSWYTRYKKYFHKTTKKKKVYSYADFISL